MLNKRLSEFYIFVPMLIAYFILGIFYPFLVSGMPKFLLFQVLFLLLPGYIFSRWLISEDLTKIQACVFGYPVSMISLFILSWIGKLLRINYLESIILIFSIISIFKILKEKSNKMQHPENGPILINIFMYIICIAIVFRMFILPSSPPTPEYHGLFYQDSLWTVGNTWAYIRDFPLQDSRFMGVPFGYHMLQNIYQATVYRYTEITPFNIHFYIEPIFDWFIMIFLIVYGAMKIARFSLKKIAIFCIGLFFTNAFMGKGLQLTLFVNPLSLYFGMASFILFIFYIIGFMRDERKPDVIYMTLLFVYIAATKAILGVIIPVALGFLFIFRVLQRRASIKEALLLLGIFLGAMFLKLTMFRGTIYALSWDYDPAISMVYQLLKQSQFLAGYSDIIYPFYRFLSNIFRSLPNYIFNWPALLFIVLLVISVRFRREVESIKNVAVFSVLFFLVSIIIGGVCVLSLDGSDFYYIWYSQMVFLILGAHVFDYIFEKEKWSYKIIALSLVILGMLLFVRDLFNWVKIGWSSLPTVKGRIWDQRVSISYDEWLAMEWLRENTDPREIFFSDRRYFAHEVSGIDLPRFFGYTALSGRQAFAEGHWFKGYYANFKEDGSLDTKRWGLIDSFLSSTDRVEQNEILKDIHADYFIQSLRFNKKDFLNISKFKLVYKNRDIKIFKIAKNIKRKR